MSECLNSEINWIFPQQPHLSFSLSFSSFLFCFLLLFLVTLGLFRLLLVPFFFLSYAITGHVAWETCSVLDPLLPFLLNVLQLHDDRNNNNRHPCRNQRITSRGCGSRRKLQGKRNRPRKQTLSCLWDGWTTERLTAFVRNEGPFMCVLYWVSQKHIFKNNSRSRH